MFKSLHKKNLGVRIMLGVIVGLLGVGMLLYLIPGQGTDSVAAADVVATVANQSITVTDVRAQLARIERTGSIPAALEPLYAQQVLNELVFQKELEAELQELGRGIGPVRINEKGEIFVFDKYETKKEYKMGQIRMPATEEIHELEKSNNSQREREREREQKKLKNKKRK